MRLSVALLACALFAALAAQPVAAQQCALSTQCDSGSFCSHFSLCLPCAQACVADSIFTSESLRCSVVCNNNDPDVQFYTCSNHDDCSASTYCDVNLNCYDCSSCLEHNDPFDGSGLCPEKCLPDTTTTTTTSSTTTTSTSTTSTKQVTPPPSPPTTTTTPAPTTTPSSTAPPQSELCCDYGEVSDSTNILWLPADCGLHTHPCPGADAGVVTRWCTADGWAAVEDTSQCVGLTLAEIAAQINSGSSDGLNAALAFLQRMQELVVEPSTLESTDWSAIILGSQQIAGSALGLTLEQHRDFLGTLDALLTASAAGHWGTDELHNVTTLLRDTLLSEFDATCADALFSHPNDTISETSVIFVHQTPNIRLECHVVVFDYEGDVLWQPAFPDATPFLRMPSSALLDLQSYAASHSIAASTDPRGNPRVLASQTSATGVSSLLLQLSSMPASAFVTEDEAASLAGTTAGDEFPGPVMQVHVPGLPASYNVPQKMTFKTTSQLLQQPSLSECARWTSGGWSSRTCTTAIDVDNSLLCQCEGFGAYTIVPLSRVADLDTSASALGAQELVPDPWTIVFLVCALVLNLVVIFTFLCIRRFCDAPRRFSVVQVSLSQLSVSICLLIALSEPLNAGCSFFGPALLASFVSLFVWQAVALRFVYIVGGLRYSVTPPSPMRMLLFGWGIGMLVLGFLVIYQFAAEDLVDNSIGDNVCWLDGTATLAAGFVPATIAITVCLGIMIAMWFLDGTQYDPARNITSVKPHIWPSFILTLLTSATWVLLIWSMHERVVDGLMSMAFVWLIACAYFAVMQLVKAINDPMEKSDIDFLDMSTRGSSAASQKLSAHASQADAVYRQQLVRQAQRDLYLGVHDYSRSDLFACVSMHIGRRVK